jgi:hypothetical protein
MRILLTMTLIFTDLFYRAVITLSQKSYVKCSFSYSHSLCIAQYYVIKSVAVLLLKLYRSLNKIANDFQVKLIIILT